MAATREPLGGGIVTLIVIDAVLVVIVVVMLLQLGRTGDPGTADGGDAGGTTSPTATDGNGSPVTFTLPSRNITCTIGAESAGCGIAEFAYAPPAVEGCSGTTGHEIEVTADGASWLCTTGDPPQPAGSGVDVLEYGESAAAAGFTCQSSPEGVTCRHDESGHAFSLARAGATLD